MDEEILAPVDALDAGDAVEDEELLARFEAPTETCSFTC
jgi:hypothetical protein